MLSGLARFATRHRWWVIGAWIAVVAVTGLVARVQGGGFTNDLSLSGTDSQAAYDTLRSEFPELAGDGMQVVLHDPTSLTTPAVKDAVEQAVAQVRTQEGIAAAISPYGPEQPMISPDGRTAIVRVQFTQRAKDIPPGAVEKAEVAFDSVRAQGVQVEYGGPAVQTESGPSGSEVYGLLAAVLVLLVAFGSLFAMAVPLVTALLALGLGLSVLELLSSSVTIGTSGPVVAAMIGLGVGIDYALLIVTRHREGLAAGTPPDESIRTAMTTAGRAVLVAGATVVVAVLSLYLIGIPFVSALGLASAITVGTTLLAATTLLPALLAVFGTNLDRYRVRRIRAARGPRVGTVGDTSVGTVGDARGTVGDASAGTVEGAEPAATGWRGWARRVQVHPWPAVTGAGLLLLILALPLLGLRLGTADGGSASPDTTQRRAYDLVESGFGPGWAGPLMVTVAYGDGGSQQVRTDVMGLRERIVATPGVAQVGPPQMSAAGDTAVLTVVPTGSPDDASTEALVHRLRDTVLPAAPGSPQTHVGGATATSIDLADTLGSRMGWFMLAVVGLAFVLLVVEFRALLVPLVAVGLNLLAVGAAYGPVVAVFQWAWWPAGLLGAQPGPIESFAPVMLFAVLFGLSTDYAVFLLSRVHESFERYGDAARAVRDGMASTGRVILAAASVMVVVFGSFMLNDQRVVNLFGFGLAVAVALYAALAIFVLVPAVLTLVGSSAWWLPRWLSGWLPSVGHVDGGSPTVSEPDDEERARVEV